MALVINRKFNGFDVIESFSCRFLNDSKDSLIVVKRHFVDAHSYQIEDGDPLITVTLTASLPFKESIVAANVVRLPGRGINWLLILTELNNLFVIGTHHKEFIILEKLHFRSSLTSQLTVEEESEKIVNSISVRPVIQVDPTNTYILIHSYHNFVQILFLDPEKRDLYNQATDQSESPIIKKRKLGIRLLSNQIFGDPSIIYLGTEVVHSIKFFNERYFCVVSRNSNLKYSVTYHQIIRSGKVLTITTVQRFPAVEGIPKLIVALKNNGLLLITDDSHHIFPPISHHISSSNDPNAIQKGSYVKCLDKDAYSHSQVCSAQEICPNTILFSHEDGSLHVGILKSSIVASNGNARLSRTTMDIIEWKCFNLGKYCNSFNKIIPVTKRLFFGYNIFGIAGFFSLDSNDQSFISLYPTEKYYNEISAMVPNKFHHNKTLFSHLISYNKSALISDSSPHISYEVTGEVKQMISFPHSTQGDVAVVLKEVEQSSTDEGKRFCLEILKIESSTRVLSEYMFDQNTYVFDLITTDVKISTCTPEAELKLSEIQDQLSDCFIVGTTGELEGDGTSTQTELILFYIDGSGNLDIASMTSLNKGYNCMLKRESDIILLGAGSVVWLTLGAYYDRQEEDVKLKFDLQNKEEKLNFDYPAISINFRSGIIVADVFEGLLFIPIFKRKMNGSVKKIQEGIFSAISKIGKNAFLVGDIMGNAYLFRSGQKSSFKLIKGFNVSDSCIETIYSDLDSTSDIDSLFMHKSESITKSFSSIALIGTKKDGLYALSVAPDCKTINILVSLQNYIIENQPSVDFPHLALNKHELKELVKISTMKEEQKEEEEQVSIAWRPLRISSLERMFTVNMTEDTKDVFPLSLDQIAVVHTTDIQGALPSSLQTDLNKLIYFE